MDQTYVKLEDRKFKVVETIEVEFDVDTIKNEIKSFEEAIA